MDAFLRRVIEQREIEQAHAVRDMDLAATDCRVCGKQLSMSESMVRVQGTVCSTCGGRKHEARLQRQDRAQEQEAARRTALLRFVGIEDHHMEAKPCSVCGKALRSDNSTGTHSACKQDAGDSPAPKRTKGTRKAFRVLTNALNVDGDGLLEEFMAGWISKVRDSVRLPGDE